MLQRYKDLQDIIAILAWRADDADRLNRHTRAEDPALPLAANFVARAIPRPAGEYVKLEDTIKGFREILEASTTISGQAFYWSDHERRREGEWSASVPGEGRGA